MKAKGRSVASLALCAFILAGFGGCTSTPAGKGAEYTASAPGNNGDVTVSVRVEGKTIKQVKVISHKETKGVCEGPIETIPAAIVKGQTLAVDTVSGATRVSQAIIDATAKCLAQAGFDVAALKTKKSEPQASVAEVVKNADIVIVGGGGAGLAAAVSASDRGASVIVIEKMGAVGGNTLVCGGIYNCPDPALQKPEGIEDSPEFYAKQTWEGGDKLANKDLVNVLCYNAYDGLQWIKSLGLKFSDKISQGAGALYRRTHVCLEPMGSGYINVYMKNLSAKKNVEILVSTKGDSLITDSTGRVVGVKATAANGGKLTLNAKKGVIIATGGFSANVEMRQKYNTSGKWPTLGADIMTTNRPGATGDGIIMAEAAGAGLVDMEQIQLLYLGNPKNGSMTRYTPRCLSGTDKIIFVNKEGNRFVREDGRRDEICGALLKQTGKIMYIIESGDGDDVVPLDKMTTADGIPVRQAEADGDLYTSDTIEGLAAKLGCSPASLKATIESFNAAVTAKKDDFGRQLYSIPMTKGPYIATPRVACVHHTMGGIRIDTKCHALDASGKVVPGLFAAGEVTGGIHGTNRLGGNAVVDTVVFGKLAGESASE
jgi:flavocytochrome c